MPSAAVNLVRGERPPSLGQWRLKARLRLDTVQGVACRPCLAARQVPAEFCPARSAPYQLVARRLSGYFA